MGILQAHFLLGGMAGFFQKDDLKVINIGKTPVWLLPQGPLSLAGEYALRWGQRASSGVGKDVTNLYRIPTPPPSLRQWHQTGVHSLGSNQFCMLTQSNRMCLIPWSLLLLKWFILTFLKEIMIHKRSILGRENALFHQVKPFPSCH